MRQIDTALLRLAQAGDGQALAELVRTHLPLVQALSRRFSWQEDALQAGSLGLVKAIRGFNLSYGVQFSTYAVPCILGEMRKAVAGQTSWRTRALLNRVRKAQEISLRERMREATIQELADAAGCPAAELMLLMEHTRLPATDDDGQQIENTADPSGETWMDSMLLRDMISRLPKRERQLLVLRYREGKNQKEVAALLHTSQATVSRMENKVYRDLKAAWTE